MSDYLEKENKKLKARLKIAMASLMDIEWGNENHAKIAREALNQIGDIK